jgi:hypothetical protein
VRVLGSRSAFAQVAVAEPRQLLVVGRGGEAESILDS